jgi:hypothetical protein
MHEVAQIACYHEEVLGSTRIHLGAQDFDGKMVIDVAM